MNEHPEPALNNRFPQTIDATQFSYTDNLAHLAIDAPIISAALRHDIRGMAPVRFQACFRNVRAKMRECTQGEDGPPADIPPEQVRTGTNTRFFVIGTQLDTHQIPASREDRTALADDTPLLLDAELAFICTTNDEDEIFVEQTTDTIEEYNYLLLAVMHGSTLPGVGSIQTASFDGLRAYFDKTLETREQILAQNDRFYGIYQSLIGACLQEYAPNRRNSE
ncbi:hypothetical protein [Salinibaculum rarum]|uniref:hypothetical protein n=1 Tax=Salinibaculum rarum TaxID=3058903 RepID=UPI00265E0FFB|nr:hypothetical protein [Salinibaculum sp. KK48]